MGPGSQSLKVAGLTLIATGAVWLVLRAAHVELSPGQAEIAAGALLLVVAWVHAIVLHSSDDDA